MLPDIYNESRSLLRGQNMYLSTEPEFLDFTVSKNYVLNISTISHNISLPFNNDNAPEFFSYLNELSRQTPAPIIFAWNFKNLNSYFKSKAGRCLDFSKVYDIKVIESFHGIQAPRPQNFEEAKNRLAATPNFSNFKKLWQEIYYPLITSVVPNIENTPLVDLTKKKRVYPYYEIEGQINGRMKCSGGYSDGYNPHAMSVLLKEQLNPAGYEEDFVYFDFKSHEVLVLQWLSQDKGLKSIIDSNKDVYAEIWTKITGVPSDDRKRKLCKDLFLPVVFGQGAKTTAENLNVSENTAKKLIENIYSSFPDALAYVDKQLSDGQIVDYFGRIRKFDQQTFKMRNFLVQSPAAVICLHKLVSLYKRIQNIAKICYHLHDGFCILVNRQHLKQVIAIGKEVLQETSDLYPGLNLRIDVKTSNKLAGF